VALGLSQACSSPIKKDFSQCTSDSLTHTLTTTAAVQSVGATEGGVKSCQRDESGRGCVRVSVYMSPWIGVYVSVRECAVEMASYARSGQTGARRCVSVQG